MQSFSAEDLDKSKPPGGPVQMSEVEFTRHLNLSWVVHRRSYFAEGGRVSKTGGGIGEVGVIESIEEFKAQFNFAYLSKRELLEQT